MTADPIAAEVRQVSDIIPETVQYYIDSIAPECRPLFDRIHRLILQARPDAEVRLSYKMPAYHAGRRRLYVGAWKHGISVYGSRQDRDGGFSARHSELVTSKGTLKLRPGDAAGIGDDEFLCLIRAALAP
jgi:hypothetical protein